MMYFLLILFFGSLIGITFMIGKKLMLIRNGQVFKIHDNITFLETPFLEKIKHVTIKNTKKHGYFLLVATIRLYFKITNFLKNKYQETKTKIKEIHLRRQKPLPGEKKEVNSFLKMVIEYKHKIRKIKQQVKDEENL